MIYDYDCDDDDNNNDDQHHTDMEKERKLLFWTNLFSRHSPTNCAERNIEGVLL